MADYSPALQPHHRRIAITGGPMAGKSTLSLQLRERTGFPVFCGDPWNKVRSLTAGVEYLPENVDWATGARRVASWMMEPGPWIVEGHLLVEALSRLLLQGADLPDVVLWLPKAHPEAYVAEAQRPLLKRTWGLWAAMETQLRRVTQVLTLDDAAQWDPLAGVRDLAEQLGLD